MKRGRSAEEQIIATLREQPRQHRCVKHGVSDAIFYKGKTKCGGMAVSDVRRQKALEDQNTKLKTLLAEAMLDNAMLRDMAARKCWPMPQTRGRSLLLPGLRGDPAARMPSDRRGPQLGPRSQPTARRWSTAIAFARDRRAAAALWLPSAAHSAAEDRCEPQEPVPQEPVPPLCRERLQVHRRATRKRSLGIRASLALPQGPNQCWLIDFLYDQLTDSPHLRILSVVDDFTRESPAPVGAPRCPVCGLGAKSMRLLQKRGEPAACVCDSGTELTNTAILRRSQQSRVATRARRTGAERVHRKLQRPSVHRVSERDAIQLARPYPNVTGPIRARPQHHSATQ
jgi:putative transposase